jgi:uncharacterized protein YifN (PemK superfamily)
MWREHDGVKANVLPVRDARAMEKLDRFMVILCTTFVQRDRNCIEEQIEWSKCERRGVQAVGAGERLVDADLTRRNNLQAVGAGGCWRRAERFRLVVRNINSCVTSESEK